MKLFRSLLFLLSWSGLLAAGTSALRAQNEQLVLDPPLSRIFPFSAGGGLVHVQVPVLLNEHTILRPDDLLRFIYIDPQAGRGRQPGEEPVPFLKSQAGPGGTTYTDPDKGGLTHGEDPAEGWGKNDSDDTATIFDEHAQKGDVKRGKQELQSEVWGQTDLFEDALDHATDVGTTFVYSTPAQKRPLTAALDLPEGMLLAEVGGHVRVLGLVQTSRAYEAGIRGGDEIRAIGGGAPLATLDDFLRDYIATKHAARISGNATYTMQVWRDGQIATVAIAAPPTIPSFL
jgi:hypothetical protein